MPTDDMPTDANTNRISGLEALVRAQAGKGPAPVEQWNPPYCGDIGLRIRADGTWLYRDSPIGRPALVKLFDAAKHRKSPVTCLATGLCKVIPKGLEPPTSWAVTRCSIQLSYGISKFTYAFSQTRCKDRNIARMLKSFSIKNHAALLKKH